jgi:sigma-B regulation protein RsbU (phosphoserine phosphatase)
VVFVPDREAEARAASAMSTSLQGALASEVIPAAATVVGKPRVESSRVSALIKAGRELAGHRPLADLFNVILDLSIESVGAQRGVLMTLEGEGLVTRATRGEDFRISTTVRDRVIQAKDSILIRDVRQDESLRARESIVQQAVRTLMAVPLQTDERVIGLIYVDSPFFIREFTLEDLNLLTVMANVAAIRIERERLAEIEQTERFLESELQQAADIQRQFLPAKAPAIQGLDIAGFNASCRTVGGDYYDFIAYPDGSVALALGDVSGKGMSAALLMMGFQARVQVLAEEPKDAGELVARLNRFICASCPRNRFITFFFCIFHPRTGELCYANAGHNPPILLRADGRVERLEEGGMVLGVMAQTPYKSARVRFDAGDMVVLFSDGVSEAVNPAGEEFGEERLADMLVGLRTQPAQKVLDAVNRAVEEWSAGAPAADDITLVAARRVAQASACRSR